MLSNKFKHINFIILSSIFFCLLILPLFWSKYYHLGGDDSRFYYLYPLEFIKNFSLKIISENGTGSWSRYVPTSYFIPIIFLFYLIKSIIPFNIQFFLYGLNLAFGFLFFYFLLGIWIKNDTKNGFLIKIISSIFYIFSPYLYNSLYVGQMLSIYLVSIIPCVLYFFIKGIYQNKIYYVVLSAVIFGLFNNIPVTIPFLGAVLIILLPLFLYIFLIDKKRFIVYASTFFILFILLNAHWVLILFHAFFTSIAGSDVLSTLVVHELSDMNIFIINTVVQINDINSLFFIIFGRINSKLTVLTFLNIFVFGLLIISGFMLNKINKKIKLLYLTTLIMLLISFFLFSPAIGDWGVKIFMWLNLYVPGFVMFRNMYDKLGLAMALSYALFLGISLKIIEDSIRNNKIKIIILLFLLILIMLNSKLLIFSERYKYPLFTTKNIYDSTTGFNSDFIAMMKYIKKSPDPSRYLWFPLNRAGFIVIGDKTLKNHYYAGISPQQYLADKQDFNSIMNFGNPYEGSFQKNIVKFLSEKNYKKIGQYAQKHNVKYIILNKEIYSSKELQNSFLYDNNIFNWQNNPNLVKYLFGKKIKDFGSRYSLYQINDRFLSSKIYLTSDFNKIIPVNTNLRFNKITNYKYTVSIKNLKNITKLVFLDPYYQGWKLYFPDRKTIIGNNLFVLNYANGWVVDPNYIQRNIPSRLYHKNIDGSIDLDLILYFKYQQYFYVSVMISIISFIICVGYLLINFIILQRKRNHSGFNKGGVIASEPDRSVG